MSERKGCWWLVWPTVTTRAGVELNAGEYAVANANDPDDSFIADCMKRAMASLWGDHYRIEWRDE